jgi:hypothetical protein
VAQFSEERYAGALETIKSARSSRSDTMYDQTPPDFDVRIDKPLSSRACPLDTLLSANGNPEKEQFTVDDDERQDFDSAVADMSRP